MMNWTKHVPKLMSNIGGSLGGLSTSCGTPLLLRYAHLSVNFRRRMHFFGRPLRRSDTGPHLVDTGPHLVIVDAEWMRPDQVRAPIRCDA